MDERGTDRHLSARAGRLAGRAVGRLGRRLLRWTPVREAVRRAATEARRDGPEGPASGR
ncbi:MAG TPA: hypothetical protein VFD49_06155 [Candidatus Dormibacteraeota bacterium]|nr:hypothetical protein [Candidatus Dormibacteraeota bacterium]